MKIPFWRSRRESDLEKEIKSHLQMFAEDHVDRGERPEEAAFRARRRLGNAAHIKELIQQACG